MLESSAVLEAALRLQAFCRKQGWRFCVIGGLAVQRWGEVRLTRDVDVTLLTGFGEEEKFIEPLLQEFQPRRPDALEFALRSRVLLLCNTQGIPLDVALGALPFEERTIARASSFRFAEDCELTTCSAEDLIVHKCFAGRDRDWLDVAGVLIRQVSKLDFGLIRQELAPLLDLKGTPEALIRLDQLIQRRQ